MHRKKRPFLFLILSLVSFIIVLMSVIFIPPSTTLPLISINIPILWLIFIPILIFSFSLPTYLLKSVKHGMLISLFVFSFLIFRLIGLTHPLFIILLLGFFLALELLFTSKKV